MMYRTGLIVLGLLGCTFAAWAGEWRFEAGEATAEAAPGAYVYDPVADKSLPNTRCLKFDGKQKAEAVEAQLPSGSFTIQYFTKREFGKEGLRPRAFASAVALADDAGKPIIEAGIHQSTPPHSYPWWEARVHGKIELAKNTYKGFTHSHDDIWRHHAVVYDGKAQTVAFYHDYTLLRREKLDKPLDISKAKLYLGGLPDNDAFRGYVDELRIADRVLSPHDFLRASAVALKDVSYESKPTVLPEASGYVDFKLRFGAIGDGKHDDTEAFRKAFRELQSRIPLAYPVLYIAPGTYRVTDTIRFTRFLVVQGAGKGKTIIKLDDKAKGFGDAKKPRPMLACSNWRGDTDWTGKGRGSGSAMGNYIFDLSLHTGKDNAGAIALDYHTNNHGCVEDVSITSGDGAGYAGISMQRRWPGPGLIKRVDIRGFDYGIKIILQEYSMTFEHVTLEGQHKAGIHNSGNILAIRKLTTRGKAPAIVSQGANSMVSLLDSEFTGGGDGPAIISEGGLFARNIKTQGYSASIKQGDREVTDAQVKEFFDSPIVSLFDKPKASIDLPVEDTPRNPDIPISEWVSVQDFADKVKGGDWSPAIQAAIDSGARAIYFPWGRYHCNSQVHLRGKVEYIHGMRTGINWNKGKGDGQPLLVFDGKQEQVVVEHFESQGVLHAAPGTLVWKHHSPLPYRNAKGCGKLFFENIVGNDYRFDHPQKVWARQLDPEQHDDTRPTMYFNGTTFWSLGFKTEYESQKIHAVNGSKLEIFGAFIYPIGKIKPTTTIATIENSSMSFIYGTSIYRSNHKVHIKEVRGKETRELSGKEVKYYGSRQRMPLYVSHGADDK